MDSPDSSIPELVPTRAPLSFGDLGLDEAVVQALRDVGYESPTPIQAATIPVLLRGVDVLGQANTGTGKTAAFALPLLSRLELARREPQALVLVPTRELAIQVAEALQKYAAHLHGFHVLPVYGGQSYTPQLNALKRGPHVVVGTPGRIMDHLEHGTLTLDAVRFVVLDEADEMLAMGFIDAIDTILARTPREKQVALFSATLPAAIRQIAQRHLRSPREVTIRAKTTTAVNIHQRYWLVSGMHKLDALTRILEVESFDAMLVFVRTKQSTVELAERLIARGFAAAALNGDIQQSQRERTVAQLKAGAIDILVATDVAARGLDVDRIGHVVNFDVPHDPESYVHRIGRTGRAGRSGEAILFIAPRERNMLRAIERATRQPIEAMNLPTLDDVNQRRIGRFKERLALALSSGASGAYRAIVEDFVRESGSDVVDVAAALASLAQGRTPLLLSARAQGEGAAAGGDARAAQGEDAPAARKQADRAPRGPHSKSSRFGPQQTYRLEVGRAHGVQPGNIVGAIANEADLDGSQINGLDIQDDHSFVRLPAGMPSEVIERLQQVRVRGRALAARPVERGAATRPRKAKPHRGRVK
ncbi:MAG TPA: DEAD/DEAH box helicase [Steroidobacteraceae bacterium]|jgi:ATP-dependent RNA helicase DeaD|nr:DEAD/DEAH box helicase [Steroidobacteraceae bacterium]